MLVGSLLALLRISEAEVMQLVVRYVQQDMLAQKRLRVSIQQMHEFRKARLLAKQDTIACCEKISRLFTGLTFQIF